jgi:pyrroloquinoline quinone biosynthesis protein D
MTDAAAWKPRLARKARLHVDRVGGKELLLFPEAALSLNPTAAAIVRLCDGERTTAAIIAELSRRFADRAAATLDRDVRGFLDTLRERGLLE